MPQLVFDVGERRSILDQQEGKSMAQVMEAGPSQLGFLQALGEFPLREIVKIERRSFAGREASFRETPIVAFRLYQRIKLPPDYVGNRI